MTNDDSATRALVLLTIDDHGEAGKVARLTFNNPTKRNALGVAGKQRVVDLLTSLKHNAALRALVITGAGEQSFVGGTDLAEMKNFDLDQAEASSTKTHRMCDAIRPVSYTHLTLPTKA